MKTKQETVDIERLYFELRVICQISNYRESQPFKTGYLAKRLRESGLFFVTGQKIAEFCQDLTTEGILEIDQTANKARYTIIDNNKLNQYFEELNAHLADDRD